MFHLCVGVLSTLLCLNFGFFPSLSMSAFCFLFHCVLSSLLSGACALMLHIVVLPPPPPPVSVLVLGELWEADSSNLPRGLETNVSSGTPSESFRRIFGPER